MRNFSDYPLKLTSVHAKIDLAQIARWRRLAQRFDQRGLRRQSLGLLAKCEALEAALLGEVQQ